MIGDCLSPGTEGMNRQSAKDICGSETVLFVTSTLLLKYFTLNRTLGLHFLLTFNL